MVLEVILLWLLAPIRLELLVKGLGELTELWLGLQWHDYDAFVVVPHIRKVYPQLEGSWTVIISESGRVYH
jgi:hypothetical protein